MPADFAFSVGDLLRCQAKFLHQVPVDLSHDLIRPPWQIQASLARKPQERIGQGHRDENAGIQDRFEAHPHWACSLIAATFWHYVTVVQSCFKSVERETIESSQTVLVTFAGKFENIS